MEEVMSSECQKCSELEEENQRLREVLTYLAIGPFCTLHMKTKIFSALNPPINKEENHNGTLNRI